MGVFFKVPILKNDKKYLESTDLNALGLKMFPVSWDFVWLPIFEPEITLCRLKSVCAKNFVCTKKTFKMTKFQQVFRFLGGKKMNFLEFSAIFP